MSGCTINEYTLPRPFSPDRASIQSRELRRTCLCIDESTNLLFQFRDGFDTLFNRLQKDRSGTGPETILFNTPDGKNFFQVAQK